MRINFKNIEGMEEYKNLHSGVKENSFDKLYRILNIQENNLRLYNDNFKVLVLIVEKNLKQFDRELRKHIQESIANELIEGLYNKLFKLKSEYEDIHLLDGQQFKNRYSSRTTLEDLSKLLVTLETDYEIRQSVIKAVLEFNSKYNKLKEELRKELGKDLQETNEDLDLNYKFMELDKRVGELLPYISKVNGEQEEVYSLVLGAIDLKEKVR